MSARLERLVNLLAALIDTERPLSRSDLQERIPGYPDDSASSRRAFERDKETLRNMGVPIVMEALDPGYPEYGEGYRVLPEDYYLPDPGFTREEMAALALAASAVKLKSQSAAAALWKMGGPAEVDVVQAVELPESDELEHVFSARRERRTLSFDYKGQRRQLDPHRLTFRNGHWYVNGFSHTHGDNRTFRLDRMEGEVTFGDRNSFPAPAPSDQPWLPPWQMGEGAPVLAHVFVDASQAEIAIAQAGEHAIKERHDDGGVVLELNVTNRDALRSFVLGFLDHAELLSPQELRDDLVSHLHSVSAVSQ